MWRSDVCFSGWTRITENSNNRQLWFDGWYDFTYNLGASELEKYESSLSEKHPDWSEISLSYQFTALEVDPLKPWWFETWKVWNKGKCHEYSIAVAIRDIPSSETNTCRLIF